MHHPAMVEELARSFQSDLLKEAERTRISKSARAGQTRRAIGRLTALASLLLAILRLPGHL